MLDGKITPGTVILVSDLTDVVGDTPDTIITDLNIPILFIRLLKLLIG